jgi:hypothetical protein
MDLFDEHDIIQEGEVATKNTILACHPHGILAYGLLWNLNTKGTAFQNLFCLGSRLSILVPFSGMFLKV